MEEKSYIGLFAIIGSDNDVIGLKYNGVKRTLFRINGEWLDDYAVPNTHRDKTYGGMVPVVDDFIEVFDKAESTGKRLVEEDALIHLRDMEF